MTFSNVLPLLIVPGLALGASNPYDSLAESVVRLYHYNVEDERIRPLGPTGTAFFVLHQGTLYLVSAGHMSKMGDLYARVPVAGAIHELMVPRTAWVVHPSSQTAQPPARRLPGKPAAPPVVKAVDVAVARVAWPEGWRPDALPLCTAGRNDPEAADPVIAAGYPRDFGAEARVQRPLLRQGIVSMKSDTPVIPVADENALADARVIVLDMLTLAGNSGSPVFAAQSFPNRKVLVGLVTSGDPELGLAFAEPLSRIRETIGYACANEASEQATWRSLR